MITRASAFFDRTSREGILVDHRRGRTLVLLIQYRLSVEDLALALNCSESIVRSLLAHQYRSLPALSGTDSPSSTEAIDARMAARVERTVIVPPSASEGEIPREVETLARHLALEVRRWLCTFEVSDADRQQVIQEAGLLLDGSPLNVAGEFDFQVNRVFLEVLGIWSKSARSSRSPEFKTRLGQWLASWIRFWIADPAVWNRALDLEFAYFGENAQAA
jgi:hypothetical protein